jgi:hypothetical protein
MNNEYRFYWRWSKFDFELQDGTYAGKLCFKIEDSNGTMVWEAGEPFVLYGTIVFLFVLIATLPLAYYFYRKNGKNRRMDED